MLNAGEVYLTDCGERLFASFDARILSIGMNFNVRDNRMRFDRERRIVFTGANFVTCLDIQCAFYGYCPLGEQIVSQRTQSLGRTYAI
jgi:hypothetical protein